MTHKELVKGICQGNVYFFLDYKSLRQRHNVQPPFRVIKTKSTANKKKTVSR